ncbi:MAG TPA: hypothetical protein EYP41_16650 [Anaerolineae bacterium]|nr:hypothetical protein [Anaerolineae bacterium]HIP71452.1 hypothetical protein [Anaerolineae bacterium]
MSRNKIYAIVEGQGEANQPLGGGQPAVVVLIGKLLTELSGWDLLYPAERRPPFRMSYGNFFKEGKLENAIKYHQKFEDCAALLILLDMDDDCPADKARELVERINRMEALPFSVVVVGAKREYESWFLASLETIHSGRIYDGESESRRDAKGWLRKNFKYKPTRHQAEYTRMALACERSRSFRRLYHAFQELIDAARQGQIIITPHFSTWTYVVG